MSNKGFTEEEAKAIVDLTEVLDKLPKSLSLLVYDTEYPNVGIIQNIGVQKLEESKVGFMITHRLRPTFGVEEVDVVNCNNT